MDGLAAWRRARFNNRASSEASCGAVGGGGGLGPAAVAFIDLEGEGKDKMNAARTFLACCF